MAISNEFILMINDERYFEWKWTTEFKQLDHTLYEFIGVITHAESWENTKLRFVSMLLKLLTIWTAYHMIN